MGDLLLHVLGACPCTHGHVDLMDLALIGGPALTGVGYAIQRAKTMLRRKGCRADETLPGPDRVPAVRVGQ